MQVIIVGTGKLATELLGSLGGCTPCDVIQWGHQAATGAQPSIVVHAGSGRELDEVAAFCHATHAPLIELATGTDLAERALACPVVICPNTNILMLKFMAMLARSGSLFHGYDIQLTESHQASKTSVPGTAVHLAESLGLRASDIQSVRDVGIQREALHIPEAALARHAYHQLVIRDGDVCLTLSSLVTGSAPYAKGVAQIIAAVMAHPLAHRPYDVMALIEQGWL
jgi:hypothetical protein